MKKLSDADIEQMIAGEFSPNERIVRRCVNAHLRLPQNAQTKAPPPPTHATLDLHQHTIEQAWSEIMDLATSGVKHATIITGASGVLKSLFQQWASDSILAPHIVSVRALNNGSFAVQFRRIFAD